MTSDEPAASANEAIDDLSQRLRRSPRPSEIAEEMGIDHEEVIESITERREPRRQE